MATKVVKKAAAKRVRGPAKAAQQAKERIMQQEAQVERPKIAQAPPFYCREGGALAKADSVVYGRGEQEYGHPAENFEDIAAFWTVFLGDKLTEPVTAVDVAQMNLLIKVARLKRTPDHRDSLVDECGYAETHMRLLNYGFAREDKVADHPAMAMTAAADKAFHNSVTENCATGAGATLGGNVHR